MGESKLMRQSEPGRLDAIHFHMGGPFDVGQILPRFYLGAMLLDGV